MSNTIILMGVPDAGKSNYVLRLWLALKDGKGTLLCPKPPDNIAYLESLVIHVLRGSFAPRSHLDIASSRSDVTIGVRVKDEPDLPVTDLLVPDVNGELWKRAIETHELPEQWMSDLKNASGAMLFLRVMSEEIVAPLDWVTSRDLLRNLPVPLEQKQGLPTQVGLCELLRFLELSLKPHPDGSLPRVAIMVTAYDCLDQGTAERGPSRYIRQEYPLFAGCLHDVEKVSIRTFGVSIVGGDLHDDEFRDRFLDSDISMSGYVVTDQNGSIARIPDITYPLAWLIRGDD
jgi:hypothetical protein